MKNVLLALLLVLSACGSPPIHYHTLAVETPQRSVPAPAGLKLRVGEVSLPPTLDRHSLVTRTGPTSLNIDQQEQWAAPLNQMIQQVLSEDLTNRLGPSRVLGSNDPNVPPDTRVLTLSIRKFIADADGTVTLDADWTLEGGKTNMVPQHRSITEPGSAAKPDAVVATMSRALGRLSDQIAASIPSGR
jgi:uncharacterized lipoprotein YmbA